MIFHYDAGIGQELKNALHFNQLAATDTRGDGQLNIGENFMFYIDQNCTKSESEVTILYVSKLYFIIRDKYPDYSIHLYCT